jgi:hypothetical protein
MYNLQQHIKNDTDSTDVIENDYIYHFINKKIKILNVGNFAVVGDTFYVA